MDNTFNFIIGPSLSFDVDNKPAFEIPLKDVSQATTGNNRKKIENYSDNLKYIIFM